MRLDYSTYNHTDHKHMTSFTEIRRRLFNPKICGFVLAALIPAAAAAQSTDWIILHGQGNVTELSLLKPVIEWQYGYKCQFCSIARHHRVYIGITSIDKRIDQGKIDIYRHGFESLRIFAGADLCQNKLFIIDHGVLLHAACKA